MVTLPPVPLVLDTDVFTDWAKRRPHTVEAMRAHEAQWKHFPHLTAISVFEVQRGFESLIVKTGNLDQTAQQQRMQAERLIQLCGVLPFNQQAASIAAHIFARLSQSQRNQHWRDVFIAATALAHNYGVATRNKSDFELLGQHLPPAAPPLHLAIWKSQN